MTGVPDPRDPSPASRAGEVALLSAQLDRIDAGVDRLLAEAEAAGEQVGALARHLTASQAAVGTHEGVAELLTRVESMDRQLEELAGAVTRLNRVQFKANALLEGKTQQVEQALEVLREIATRREDLAAARLTLDTERKAELRREGRAALATDLLPVLDGIERALESGATLLEQRRAAAGPAEESPGLLRVLWKALSGEPQSAGSGAEAGGTHPQDGIAAWLDGLALGRTRLLALLAAEDIRPIQALARIFDPRFHVAVATEERDDLPPGTVVDVLRPGYRRGERPVRFAEVVVSRAAGAGVAANGEETLDPTNQTRS